MLFRSRDTKKQWSGLASVTVCAKRGCQLVADVHSEATAFFRESVYEVKTSLAQLRGQISLGMFVKTSVNDEKVIHPSLGANEVPGKVDPADLQNRPFLILLLLSRNLTRISHPSTQPSVSVP